MKRARLGLKLLLPLALGCFATPIRVRAQIVPDATLPQNSTVNVEDRITRIVGGTRAGGNLFHSFQEFSVPSGRAAYFDNALDLQNIFARVTGGSISNIDGILRANGSANLFLINPGGIVFGPNATLELGGSFAASTADSAVFDNGFEFSATSPNASPLLAVNIPIGLRFRESPGEIRVAGSGHNARFNPDTSEIVFDDRPVGLQVGTGKTLALLGGDVTLVGGNLTAEEGRIEISSGRGGSLSLSYNGQNIAIAQNQSPRQLGTVRFEQAASADVSGSGSGDVQIVGQNIVLSDRSAIFADTLGSNDGGLVTLQASESVAILSSSTNGFASGIQSDTRLGSTGTGGSIRIKTEQLTLSDDSEISSDTRGTGNAGNVEISSERLSLRGGEISSETFEKGNAGNVEISSQQLTLNGGARISSDTSGAGKAGNVEIFTEQFLLSDRSIISSDTNGLGNAGSITVTATEVEISGTSSLTEQEQVTSTSSLAGLLVRVEASATGQGGDITIDAERLVLRDGGQIAVSTKSSGNAGSLRVRAGIVELIGGNSSGRSGLFASALDATENGSGTGEGGNLNVIADRVVIQDGAIVSASNFHSRNLTPQGKGPAGNITIEAREILLDNDGTITAAAAAGDRGNILLNADNIQLRRGSMVTASAEGPATGGNIIIRTDNLAALEDSDISANAQQSSGGNIAIQAEGIFGTEFRDRETPESDITATSELGAEFSGTVTLNVTDVDPGAAIAIFPQTVVDIGRLIGQTLCTQGRKSSFTVSGRGGLPPNPNDFLDSGLVSIEPIEPSEERSEAEIVQEREIPSVTVSPASEPSQIVPAQGWVVNENGEVELVSYNTAASESRRSWRGRPSCHKLEKISQNLR